MTTFSLYRQSDDTTYRFRKVRSSIIRTRIVRGIQDRISTVMHEDDARLFYKACTCAGFKPVVINRIAA